MEERKSFPDQIGDFLLDFVAHCQQAFLPLLSVSASHSKNTGFRDIAVCLHEFLQFRTPQRIKKHILLQVGWNLRIWNDQFRKNGMGSATFLASDPKNAKDNGPLPGLKPSSVITMAYQTTGMTAVATELIQWNIRRYLSVNFRSYPLEACENSCYHDNAMMSNDFRHCWLYEQGPGFPRAWVPAFRYECRLKSQLS